MPSFREQFKAVHAMAQRHSIGSIAQNYAPKVMTIINLVGALSSTSTLLLPNTPAPPVIITPPPSQTWMPPIAEDEKRQNAISRSNLVH